MTRSNGVVPPCLDTINKRLSDTSNIASEVFEIQTVTPMIGGSSTPGKVNEKEPVRSASIRGHLRFWWRATRGAAFAEVSDLRRREAEIFGDTETPSRVKIWVSYGEATKANAWVPNYIMINRELKASSDRFKFNLHLQYSGEGEESDSNPLSVKALKRKCTRLCGLGSILAVSAAERVEDVEVCSASNSLQGNILI
ncbi:hypothetical protein PACILC2_55700 [Paenibacillus cisolokensis]|uniref:CRISPR type III-associated protein domain-containing protein n=1 Tax=Paenibacillus cisolokensis TaxID=1658519 RepID=A0ABQ4NFH3_9BACL|nr:type III-B CRISPR module RAMP protein Cmr1 [Paenibacillus cisolokensis]GIQ67002.1 hypothetical protein PACILC2_55700 [Paenibacillus cisolokensis]